MNDIRRDSIGVLLITSLTAIPAAAAPVVLDALDSGFYFDNGTHNPGIENYLTGLFNEEEHRSFFVFDLSSIAGTIEAATLRLFNPEVSATLHGYVSPDPTETLNIYDVSTPAADITLNAAGVEGFDDLGSGILYGSTTVSAADNGTVVEIALGGAAIADLNAATGLLLLGGALDTIGGTSDQYVFGFSMAGFVADHTRQLVLDVSSVAEPSSLSLIVLSLLLSAACAGRRRLPSMRGTQAHRRPA
jgi:hypothetical protein